MLDPKVFTRKLRKKVWDVFQTMRDETEFLKELAEKEPERFNTFIDNEFTNEEAMRLKFLLTKHP